jgi:hypothetical protein
MKISLKKSSLFPLRSDGFLLPKREQPCSFRRDNAVGSYQISNIEDVQDPIHIPESFARG